MTPEEIQDLAADIVLELQEWAFEGDEWISNQVGIRVVAQVLTERLTERLAALGERRRFVLLAALTEIDRRTGEI